MPTDKVCAEFFGRFPKYRKEVTNAERVAFMLSHPTIRPKLDEWIEGGKSAQECPPGPGSKRKKTNVTNQFIDADDNGENDKESIQSQSQQSSKDRDNNSSKHLKNPAQSGIQRELGNSLFKEKKLLLSLESYNQAIAFAPFHFSKYFETEDAPKSKETFNANTQAEKESELLALSLANRSAVYFELGEAFYENALEDVDLALKYGYPARLRTKLLLRKANIYVRRREWELAQGIIKQIEETDVNVNVLGGGDEKSGPESDHLPPDVLAKIKELRDKMEVSKDDAGDANNKDCDGTAIVSKRKPFVSNDEFENASEAVEISYSDWSTRFVRARADLKKGDVVFEEMPFASVLLPPFYESHCHHCHVMLENGHFFPCQKCSQVKFCTEKCAQYAWKSYHQHECLSLDLLHSVGIAHLAVRVTLTAGAQDVLKATERDAFLKDPENISIFSKGSSNYERVYSLLDHLGDMHLEDVFQYCLTASLLTNWLIQKTLYLSGLTANDQIKVGGAMLRHICQLICNAHAITDVLNDINMDKISLSTSDESQQRVASAIFPAASMMNHSCDPNIVFGFINGKRLIVKVVQDVKEGDEVFNCYGPHFRRMNRNTRQTALREQYFFDCACKSCVAEASGNSFMETFLSFKCEKCEGPVAPPDPGAAKEEFLAACRDCGESQDLQDAMKACMYTDRLFQDGEVLLERGKVEQALKIFQACQNQRQRILYKFHSNLGQIWDIIGRCYAMIGEFGDAVSYVKESLAYVEKRFGPESIEFGRETKKYADLLSQVDKDKHGPEIRRLVQRYKSILDIY